MDTNVEELFRKCTKFYTMNTFLKPNARKDLMDLYLKIYGLSFVTNNEFVGCLVKGYIANLKKKKVNWTLVALTIASKKANRVYRLLLRLMNLKCRDDEIAS